MEKMLGIYFGFMMRKQMWVMRLHQLGSTALEPLFTMRVMSDSFPFVFQQGVLETETGQEPSGRGASAITLACWVPPCHGDDWLPVGTGGRGGERQPDCRQGRLLLFVPDVLALWSQDQTMGVLSFPSAEPKTGVYEFWGFFLETWPVNPAASGPWVELVHYSAVKLGCVATLPAMLLWQCNMYLEILVRPTTKWWKRSSQEWLSFWLNNMSKKSYMK